MSETINYQNVANLPVLEEATENTYVIVEDNGEFRRMSGDNLGGGGIKTAIIRNSEYLNTIAGLQTASASVITYECVNMTFDEAWATLMAGEPLGTVLQIGEGGAILNDTGIVMATMIQEAGAEAVYNPAIAMEFAMVGVSFLWNSDGITNQPE